VEEKHNFFPIFEWDQMFGLDNFSMMMWEGEILKKKHQNQRSRKTQKDRKNQGKSK
jgi:hypothetical protein